MRKATSYKLVRNPSEDEVEKQVNKLLREGWMLHGPLIFAAASNDEQQDWFLQPMVRADASESGAESLEKLARAVSDIADSFEDLASDLRKKREKPSKG